jgi:hypothetical protein
MARLDPADRTALSEGIRALHLLIDDKTRETDTNENDIEERA